MSDSDKYLIQLVDHENGTRSKPFTSTLPNLARMLKANEDIDPENFVLVLTKMENDSVDFESMLCPLMTIRSFVSTYRASEVA